MDPRDLDWLDLLGSESNVVDPDSVLAFIREDLLDPRADNELGPIASNTHDVSSHQAAEGQRANLGNTDVSTVQEPHEEESQHKKGFPQSISSAGKPAYALRPRQEANEEVKGEGKGENAGKRVEDPQATSLCIKGTQPRGFLIPMRSFLPASSPGPSAFISDMPSSSYQKGIDQSSSSSLSRERKRAAVLDWTQQGFSLPGTVGLSQRGRSLRSLASEQTRVVTPSALLAPLPSAASDLSEDQVEAGGGPGAPGRAEVKRRRRKEGLPTTRVTRSGSKKDKPGPTDTHDPLSHLGEVSADVLTVTGTASNEFPAYSHSLAGTGFVNISSAVEPSCGPPAQQGQLFQSSLPPSLLGPPYGVSDRLIGQTTQMPLDERSPQDFIQDRGLTPVYGFPGLLQNTVPEFSAARPPRHPSFRSNSRSLPPASQAFQSQRRDTKAEVTPSLVLDSRATALIAMEAEACRLQMQNDMLWWELSQESYRQTAAEASEKKVKLLVAELDRLRTSLPGLSLKQTVDLVQSINDARSPQPQGRNSSYSQLFGLLMANEPNFGLKQGCFNSWMQKKDITGCYSIIERTYAFGMGITAAGEAEMEVVCSTFPNCRVKIKELKDTSLETYMTIRTFYSQNMMTLLAMAKNAGTTEEFEKHKNALKSSLMESACMEHLFIMSNPSYHQCSENWIVQELDTTYGEKAEAMIRFRDKMLEVGADVGAIRQLNKSRELKLLPWNVREAELKAEIESLKEKISPHTENCRGIYSRLIHTVGELQEVAIQQRAIHNAAIVSCFFAGMDPYQMAEAGSACMPHLPDIDYLLQKGMLP